MYFSAEFFECDSFGHGTHLYQNDESVFGANLCVCLIKESLLFYLHAFLIKNHVSPSGATAHQKFVAIQLSLANESHLFFSNFWEDWPINDDSKTSPGHFLVKEQQVNNSSSSLRSPHSTKHEGQQHVQ